MKLRHALSAATLLAAEPAQAAEYIITYTGTVSASHDGTGTFGDPNASLDGLTFTATYLLTAPLPGANTFEEEFSARIWGGAEYAAPSPLSATLTINGITQAVSGNQRGDVEQKFVPDEIFEVGEIRHLVKHFDQALNHEFLQSNRYLLSNFIRSGFGNFDFLNTTDYTASLDYDVRPGDVSTGSFRFEEFRYDGIYYAYGDLTATHVTIAAAPLGGAVPEPATWAMMLLGIGAVAAGLRSARQRRRPPGAFALAHESDNRRELGT